MTKIACNYAYSFGPKVHIWSNSLPPFIAYWGPGGPGGRGPRGQYELYARGRPHPRDPEGPSILQEVGRWVAKHEHVAKL